MRARIVVGLWTPSPGGIVGCWLPGKVGLGAVPWARGGGGGGGR